MMRASLRTVFVSILCMTAMVEAAAAQTGSDVTDRAAADIVATQIRSQGYACDEPSSAKPDQKAEPSSAKPDQKASRPDETAWILTCKNATYRVKLVPDMAAQVEQLD
jgi:hypothetical protein